MPRHYCNAGKWIWQLEYFEVVLQYASYRQRDAQKVTFMPFHYWARAHLHIDCLDTDGCGFCKCDYCPCCDDTMLYVLVYVGIVTPGVDVVLRTGLAYTCGSFNSMPPYASPFKIIPPIIPCYDAYSVIPTHNPHSQGCSSPHPPVLRTLPKLHKYLFANHNYPVKLPNFPCMHMIFPRMHAHYRIYLPLFQSRHAFFPPQTSSSSVFPPSHILS